MIRVSLVALAMALFFLLSLPLYLVLVLIGKKNPMRKTRIAQSVVAWAFNIVLWFAGTKRTVLGLENVPKDTPVLYVTNHRSFADIPIIYTSVPTLAGFVAKKEIEKVPGLNIWMKLLNCLFLDRNDLRAGLKVILQGIENIKQGYSMIISPEGTRNHGKELLPFKEGSMKMAEKTGCPIIPVAINNSDAVFELQAPRVKRAHVVIEYGKPIYLTDLSRENRKFLGAYVRNVIAGMIVKNEPLV